MIPSGTISPQSIMQFVQEHAQEYGGMVKDEMTAAKHRSDLMRDVADLSAMMTHMKTAKDWDGAGKAIAEFVKNHPDDAIPADFKTMSEHFAAWRDNKSCVGLDKSSTGLVWGIPDDATRNGCIDAFVTHMNDWKDKVGGDDKLAMMSLTQHAEDLKNIYQLGSNLNAALNQPLATLIGNIKG